MAEDDDDASKTEEPTDKKLSQAKEEGQVAQSQEIKSWASFFAGAVLIVFLIPFIATSLLDPITFYITRAHEITVSEASLAILFERLLADMGLRILPLMIVFMVVGVVANVVQTGLIWAPKKIMPKLDNISPKKGMKKVASTQSVVELLKTIFKMSLVGAVAAIVIIPVFVEVELMPAYDLFHLLELMYDVSVLLMIGVTSMMTIIAGIDYSYQRFTFMKQMRMTQQDVKDEHKQSEGDPLIKAKIRQLRMERARNRMMSSVPDADVVVTNPTHYACVLKYEQGSMQAPRLVAKGVDNLAFRIRTLAEDNEIPIVENPPLARALYASVEIDEEIPPEHYAAVAEIIGYVMKLKGQLNS